MDILIIISIKEVLLHKSQQPSLKVGICLFVANLVNLIITVAMGQTILAMATQVILHQATDIPGTLAMDIQVMVILVNTYSQICRIFTCE